MSYDDFHFIARPNPDVKGEWQVFLNEEIFCHLSDSDLDIFINSCKYKVTVEDQKIVSLKEAICEMHKYRNDVVRLYKKLPKLLNKLKSIDGEFKCYDQDGDVTEEFNNLGEAFDYTCEIDSVCASLYIFITEIENDLESEG